MPEPTKPARPAEPVEISTGEWVRGFAFVVIVTVAVAGTAIWALASFVFRCACTTPA